MSCSVKSVSDARCNGNLAVLCRAHGEGVPLVFLVSCAKRISHDTRKTIVIRASLLNNNINGVIAGRTIGQGRCDLGILHVAFHINSTRHNRVFADGRLPGHLP